MRVASRQCCYISWSRVSAADHPRVFSTTPGACLCPDKIRAGHVHGIPAHRVQRSSARPMSSCQATPDGEASGSAARVVARELVGQFVQSKTTVAVDSGELCTAIIQEIGERLREGGLQNVSIVPSCDAAASEAAFVGVPQVPSADVQVIDVMFSDVDEVDVSSPQLPFVFGRRREPAQPQIPRFRAVAKKAKTFVALLSSEEQAVDRLGRDLPVLLQNEVWEDAAEQIDDIFVGDAEIWRRTADATPATSPKGDPNPYVSADGSTIIDIQFYGDFCLVEDSTVPYEQLAQEIMAVPGAMSVGLMEGVATHVAISGRSADAKLAVFSKEQLQEARVQADTEQEQGQSA